MKKNRLSVLLAIISLFLGSFLLSGCGGGGGDGGSSSGGSTTPAVKTGVFADAPVDGINYKTATQAGVTANGGQFKYMDGETVAFSIGNTTLGAQAAKPVLTPVDLVAGATDQTDPKVTKMVQLILSLADNPNAATLNIGAANIAAMKAATAIDLAPTNDVVADEVNFFFAVNRVTGSVPVDATTAQSHMAATLGTVRGDVSKYAGSYSGTWSGYDTGSWDLTVSSTGVITGSGYNNIDNTTGTGSGSVGSDGSFNMVIGTTSSGATFTGTVDATGKMSGTWKDGTATGSFIGQKKVASSPTSGTSTAQPTIAGLAGTWKNTIYAGNGNVSKTYVVTLVIDDKNNAVANVEWDEYNYGGHYHDIFQSSGQLTKPSGSAYDYVIQMKGAKFGTTMSLDVSNIANNQLNVKIDSDVGILYR